MSDTIVTIGDEVFVSKGNISMITGKPKTGKSLTLLALLGSAMSQEPHLYDFLGFKCDNTNKKAVLYFNPEGGKGFFYDRTLKALSVAKCCDYTNLYAYHAASFGENTLDLIASVVSSASIKNKNGIKLILIDQIDEIIGGCNRQKESGLMVKTLKDIAEKYNTAVVGTIHMACKRKKMNGHLGSILHKNSETVLQVSRSRIGARDIWLTKFGDKNIIANVQKWIEEKYINVDATKNIS